MSTIRKGVEQFLRNREAHSKYLIPRWSIDLESQFLVHPGSVEVEENSNCWTDGSEIWAPHRWPYKAGSDPSYRDKTLKFDPVVHISRVGSTWWNWKTRRSVAVAFDIDTDDNHAVTTNTVTETELEAIVEKLKALTYVTLIRSTGGSGVHIYVFFDEDRQPEAVNHNEHTQVALAVLEKMKKDLEYDLGKHMDAKGLVFWFWSDTSDENHPGFTVIQEQTSCLSEDDIKPYLNKNLRNPNRKVTIHGYTDDGQNAESQKDAGGYKVHPLEEAHREILRELETSEFSFIWNAEFNMAHTHTVALKQLYEKRKEEGRPLRGMFETVSQGTDKSKPNCYITPRPGGVFQVKRFGNGIGEHPLWHSKDQDTWCFYNHGTSVDNVLKKFSAKYDGNKFMFQPSELEAAMKALGHSLGESVSHIQSVITVHRKKDGTFYASCTDQGNFDGWQATKQGQKRDLPFVQEDGQRQTSMLEEVDEMARFVVTPGQEPYGWFLNTESGWIQQKSYDYISPKIVHTYGKESNYVKMMMLENPWTLAHVPFGPEYPPYEGKLHGVRLWNKFAPQLAIEPAEKPGPHPHWDMIYNHLGSSLDSAVSSTLWCQQWGMATGADYLRCWLASAIQCPFEPLPYLFFYGDQNTGKSIFRESAAYLFSEGSVMSASGALTNQSGFNFELASAIIGYVEEKNLSEVKDGAYARMKEWVADKTMTVTKKGETPYNQPNTIKLVHMANSPIACPMEGGDTRITAIAVAALLAIIPKGIMERKLREEAPFFLRTLLTTNLPESPDRLRVPMLANSNKADLEAMNLEPWEAFASETLYPSPGGLVKFSDFYVAYDEHCTIRNIEPAKSKTILQLIRNRSNKYTVGISSGKQMYIGNATMDPKAKTDGVPLKLNKNGRLVKCTT